MAADLIARARGGDEEAFRQLVDPYRSALHVHCYRILGSPQDAEDALQETLLAAWQGLGGFEGRSSIRTWLYRVATSRCLLALRTARRSPAGWARSPGWSPTPTSSWPGWPTTARDPRRGMRPPSPSRWPSSRPCS